MMRSVSLNVVRSLVEAGAALNLPDTEGRSPLVLALCLAHRSGLGTTTSRSGNRATSTLATTDSPSRSMSGVWSGGSYWLNVANVLTSNGGNFWGPSSTPSSPSSNKKGKKLGKSSRYISSSARKRTPHQLSPKTPTTSVASSVASPSSTTSSNKDTPSSALPTVADYAPFRDRAHRTPLHLLMAVIPLLTSSTENQREEQENGQELEQYNQYSKLLSMVQKALLEMAQGRIETARSGVQLAFGSPTSAWGWDWTDVDTPDRSGATALLYACRALSRLPACEEGHPLYKWGLSLLRCLVAAGADVRARDDAGSSPSVLGQSPTHIQTQENNSLYRSVWPTVRQDAKSMHTKHLLAQKTRAKYTANVENAGSNIEKGLGGVSMGLLGTLTSPSSRRFGQSK